jgi:phenylalanyl-tRNA synthetase alpha chain
VTIFYPPKTKGDYFDKNWKTDFDFLMEFHNQFGSLNTISACLKLRDELNNTNEIKELKEKIINANAAEKPLLGSQLNTLKKEIQLACDNRIKQLQENLEKEEFIQFDPTFYSQKYQIKNGSIHPISQTVTEIVEIFSRLGFDVFEGDLVETQYYNFTSVNTPDYHPARDMQDTFFLKQTDKIGENFVMKTQVTASAVKYAHSHKAPFRVIFPGIVFRNENIDATHDINFTQFDMWLVDKNCNLGQLISLIERFFSEFFGGKEITTRFRPSYFPFTQPSMEGDIRCPFCDGAGCRICKQTGWIEVFGAGPIHRNVIQNMNLDPEIWNGLAFGFGVDRLAQLKLDLSGVSQFYNGNIKFLKGREL